MPIAGARIGIAFDGSIGRNRHRPEITLIAVRRVVNIHWRLRGVDDHVRNAHVAAVVFSSAKIRVDADARTDVINDGGGIRIDGGCGYVLVPGVVRGEGKKAIQTRSCPVARLLQEPNPMRQNFRFQFPYR